MLNKKADRAKIFLPFDSLKGFREYIQKKERIKVEQKELLPDACDILNRKIHQVKVGKIIKIIYYDKQEYIALEGMVSFIDLEYKKILKIVEKTIDISTIIEISGEGIEE